jgi:hypothetical protein
MDQVECPIDWNMETKQFDQVKEAQNSFEFNAYAHAKENLY